MFTRLSEYTSVFHILDSLPPPGRGRRETSQLQKILLRHFEGAAFEEGRIKTNFAEVIAIFLNATCIGSFNCSGASAT